MSIHFEDRPSAPQGTLASSATGVPGPSSLSGREFSTAEPLLLVEADAELCLGRSDAGVDDKDARGLPFGVSERVRCEGAESAMEARVLRGV